MAHCNLGTLLQEQEKLDEAVDSYRQAIKLKPDYAMTYCNLGTLLQEQGETDEATANYNRAIEINPDYAEAHFNMGNVLHDQGSSDKALSCYQRAIDSKPDYADAHYNIGALLQEQARFDEAIPHYKHTLEINPEHVNALGNIADIWERKNYLNDAQLCVEKGLALAPDNPFLNLIAAKLERRQGRNQDAIDRLEKIELTGRFGAKIQFLLGQLKDKTGNTDEAFEHFMVGNSFNSEQFSCRNVNKDTYLQGINKLEEYFKQDVFEPWTTSPVSEAEEHPVFIIGFPRSGTTLLDQILDSHPGIQTLEEKPIIPTLVGEISKLPNGFPDALSNITQDHISQLRTHYSQLVSKYIHRQDGTVLIDKLPLNTSLIPLIWMIFPQAKIILSLRHPCDVCLSCFMQDFEANEAMANFLSLENTANLYSKVMGLWKRYEEIFPLDYHIIKYEDLVADFESETRKTLDFLGVEWDDKVLKYNDHARKRDRIRTPSYHQVTRPIYQHAKYRWQKYTDQLDPIMETLKPFIEYFGYCTGES
jgi:tetratricopeptide (TPR) repeat protein